MPTGYSSAAAIPVTATTRRATSRPLVRVELLRAVLREMGVEDERLRLEWISASEGDKVQRVCNEMTADLRRLGPLRLIGPAGSEARLEASEVR